MVVLEDGPHGHADGVVGLGVVVVVVAGGGAGGVGVGGGGRAGGGLQAVVQAQTDQCHNAVKKYLKI